jgi:hypothetical protein
MWKVNESIHHVLGHVHFILRASYQQSDVIQMNARGYSPSSGKQMVSAAMCFVLHQLMSGIHAKKGNGWYHCFPLHQGIHQRKDENSPKNDQDTIMRCLVNCSSSGDVAILGACAIPEVFDALVLWVGRTPSAASDAFIACAGRATTISSVALTARAYVSGVILWAFLQT